MRYILYAFWTIVIILGVTFASLNPEKITLNYYIDTQTVHLPLVLLGSLVIGAFLGVMAMLPSVIKSKAKARRLNHHVKQVEQEVQNLRTIPIKDRH
jgi:putative membrane protein